MVLADDNGLWVRAVLSGFGFWLTIYLGKLPLILQLGENLPRFPPGGMSLYWGGMVKIMPLLISGNISDINSLGTLGKVRGGTNGKTPWWRRFGGLAEKK